MNCAQNQNASEEKGLIGYSTPGKIDKYKSNENVIEETKLNIKEVKIILLEEFIPLKKTSPNVDTTHPHTINFYTMIRPYLTIEYSKSQIMPNGNIQPYSNCELVGELLHQETMKLDLDDNVQVDVFQSGKNKSKYVLKKYWIDFTDNKKSSSDLERIENFLESSYNEYAYMKICSSCPYFTIPVQFKIIFLQALNKIVTELLSLYGGKKITEEKFQKTPSVIYNIFLQLVCGLNFLECYKIEHNDIKAGNILINNSSGQLIVKFIDFNIGRNLSITAQIDSQKPKGYSPIYYAPEILDGSSKIDNIQFDPWKAQIYSMGILLLELIGFFSPSLLKGGFDKFKISEKKYSHFLNDFEQFSKNQTDLLTKKILKVIEICISFSPDNRLSANELIQFCPLIPMISLEELSSKFCEMISKITKRIIAPNIFNINIFKQTIPQKLGIERKSPNMKGETLKKMINARNHLPIKLISERTINDNEKIESLSPVIGTFESKSKYNENTISMLQQQLEEMQNKYQQLRERQTAQSDNNTEIYQFKKILQEEKEKEIKEYQKVILEQKSKLNELFTQIQTLKDNFKKEEKLKIEMQEIKEKIIKENVLDTSTIKHDHELLPYIYKLYLEKVNDTNNQITLQKAIQIAKKLNIQELDTLKEEIEKIPNNSNKTFDHSKTPSKIRYKPGVEKIINPFGKTPNKHLTQMIKPDNKMNQHLSILTKDLNNLKEDMNQIRNEIKESSYPKEKLSSINLFQKLISEINEIANSLIIQIKTPGSKDLENSLIEIDSKHLIFQQEKTSNYYLFFIDRGIRANEFANFIHVKNLKTSENFTKSLYSNNEINDAALHNHSIYICGGNNGQRTEEESETDNCIIINLINKGVDASNKLFERKTSINLVSTNSYIFCLGGFKKKKMLNHCEYFKSEDKKWEQISSLNYPNDYINSCFDFKEYIYNFYYTSCKNFERLNITNLTNSWDRLSINTNSKTRIFSSSVLINNNEILIFGGGYSHPQESNHFLKFSFLSKELCELDQELTGCNLVGSRAVYFKDSLWIIDTDIYTRILEIKISDLRCEFSKIDF